MSNGRLPIKAQVSLELVASLIACLILIVGVSRIFVWMNESIVKRQENYQLGRKISSSDINNANQINFYTPERLYIFSKEKP